MNEHWITSPVYRGLDLIKDIFTLVNGRGYIAGSYAAYMGSYMAVDPNDIDIFAVSEEAAQSIARDLIALTGREMTENPVAITIHRGLHELTNLLPIQIVKPSPDWKTFPDDILNNFDLDICRAVLIDEHTLLADVNAGILQGKFLRINNPLRSLKRALKYHKRGVEFDDHELLKLFDAWDQTPAERKEGLKQQATAEWEQMRAARQEVGDIDDGEEFGYWYDDSTWFEGE